jgi:DNA invertase Pin-like site-specific DNA recombinase
MTTRAKPRRAAFYLRVSTGEQTAENQRRELAAVAERAGWEIVEVYEDAGISGAKGRDKRPALDRLLKDATRRRFDLVAAWSVDRLGRSLPGLVHFLEEIHGAGIDLYLHRQGFDTTTPTGRAMFGMLGVFSEFERAMIQERVKAGLARARANGTKLGRPRLPEGTETAILTALCAGTGIQKTAKTHGVGVSAVQRIKAEAVRDGRFAVQAPEPAPPDEPKVMKVKLWLVVENNSQWVRGKTKVLREIETFVLAQFGMVKPDPQGGEYLLSIPYTTDAELDEIIYDEIFSEMQMRADDRHCFIEADMTAVDNPERSW